MGAPPWTPPLWDDPSHHAEQDVGASHLRQIVAQVAAFPRIRYMGSKYRLVPHLAALFDELHGRTVLDAFSGSGVVAYLLKALGCSVTTNDFLAFPTVIAQATVENQHVRLTQADIDRIVGPPIDDRDFIQRTFHGLYFTADDRAFLDSAWSQATPWGLHRHRPAIRRRAARPPAPTSGALRGDRRRLQRRRLRQRAVL
jgi:adenine-specific DNA-methyltransferase